MDTVNYLNALLTVGNTLEDCLEELNARYAIKISTNTEYPDLYVLNYDQIESIKLEPIVMECRSLVISHDNCGFYVVSRSFDRFLNWGESDNKPDVSTLTAHEKMDGSLIGVFNYQGEWLYRTRSMIMPTTPMNDFGVEWKDFIEDGLDWPRCCDQLDVDFTYILEATGKENRIVVKYNERKAFHLATRDNQTGTYSGHGRLGWSIPAPYKFSTIGECIKAAKGLQDLEEGFVCYDTQGVPVCKVKNPAYVAAHLIRGEGLTAKRVMRLILTNEQDEYLTLFPEDLHFFQPYIDGLANLIREMEDCVRATSYLSSKRDFAMAVKDLPYSAVMFRKFISGGSLKSAIDSQTEPYKLRLLELYVVK